MAWKVTASPVRFDEAIDWFRAKAGNAVTREQWDALDERARRRAFMVSGLTKVDIIQRVWEQLDKAIEQGLSFQDFRKSATKDLADTWLSKDSPRLELIYRNNVQSAFAAGRYLQATSPDALEQHPIWMLDVIMDSLTSDVCEPLDGVMRPAVDPWWVGRIPPLHHNCRTGILTLDHEDAHEMGGITDPAPDTRGSEGWGARPELDEWGGEPTEYAPELQSEARRVIEEARRVGPPLARPELPKSPKREQPVEAPSIISEPPDEGPVRVREGAPHRGYEIPSPHPLEAPPASRRRRASPVPPSPNGPPVERAPIRRDEASERGVFIKYADPLFEEASEEIFKGPPPTIDAFEAMWRGGGVDYQVKVRNIGLGEKAMHISSVVEHQGQPIANMARTFYRDKKGKLVAKHDFFKLPAGHQGAGLGEEMMRNAINAYLHLGVDRIEVDAAWVGRYTWARFGVTWDKKTADKLRPKFYDFLTRNGVDAAAAKQLSRRTRYSWQLAETVIGGRKLGKEFLLDSGTPMWSGSLPLHSRNSRAWKQAKKRLKL